MPDKRRTVGERGIAIELQRLRKEAGKTLEEASELVGLSASTLSRIETGKRPASSEEVASLLVVYGVRGSARERLLDIARRSTETGLLEATVVNASEQSRTYTNFEIVATRITDAELILIPGLAQTPDYSRAVISAIQVGETDSDIDARVARRMARQAILTRPSPPELHMIITEAALRLPLGGPKIMARQVRHLIDLAERPTISIRVIPASVVSHPGLGGHFAILDFEADPTVVFVEARTSGLFLDDAAEVDVYRLTVDKLTAVALDGQQSVGLMTSIERDLGRE